MLRSSMTIAITIFSQIEVIPIYIYAVFVCVTERLNPQSPICEAGTPSQSYLSSSLFFIPKQGLAKVTWTDLELTL